MLQKLVDFFIAQASISGEHLGWLIFAGIVVIILLGVFFYATLSLIFDLLRSIKVININRPEKIVKVPEYIVPPVNKEMDRYLEVLKKILKEYEDNNKLLP
jgi:hypothetical protein